MNSVPSPSGSSQRAPIRPLTKDEINALPMTTYEGPVRVVCSNEELEDALEALSGESLLGLDTETRPSFRRGKAYATALLQLAGAHEVVLIRLKQVDFAPALVALLEHPGIIKAGVAIGDDMKGLQRLHPFTPAGHADLSQLARSLGLASFGLRPLAAALLRCRISKGAQCSNWENTTLTSTQIRYAATDAWIGREIYLRLAALRDGPRP